MYGYAGNILRVDLSSGRVSHEPLTEELVHNYIGGRGFGAYYVYKEVPPGADPYGPHNILVFASGPPFAGLFLPSAAKTSISAKSPATELYGDSNVGGGHLAGGN